LSDRRCEHEVHLETLLYTRPPVLDVDRSCELEHFLPLLRSCRVGADVAAAVHVRQFAVADDLQRLHSHDAVPPAESLGGARHELESGGRSLTGHGGSRVR
jgi:hypothetical protein